MHHWAEAQLHRAAGATEDSLSCSDFFVDRDDPVHLEQFSQTAARGLSIKTMKTNEEVMMLRISVGSQ